MTEADWVTGTDFAAMAQFAAERLSPRRQRLLAVAFCRAVEHLIDHPELIDALATVEGYADELRDTADIEKVRHRCREIAIEAMEGYARQVDGGASGSSEYVRGEMAWAVACAASEPLTPADVGSRVAQAAVQARLEGNPLTAVFSTGFDAATAEQVLRLRGVVWEVVGNPFRPVNFAPWRTGTAVPLARTIYESREFSAMPILADALQDAGCDSEDVLNHCREPHEHVRGCWVIDGVLSL